MVRYEKGHKGETRQHILNAASKRFRQGGLAQGIGTIMKGAGLTHGGFYAHFRSKEDLIRESLLLASAKKRKGFANAAKRGGLDGLVSEYLSEAHRDRPDIGCTFASLISELGRLSRKSRTLFAQELDAYFDLIASLLLDQSEAERRRKAMQVYGIMLGSLQLARATTNPETASWIMTVGAEAAIELAKK